MFSLVAAGCRQDGQTEKNLEFLEIDPLSIELTEGQEYQLNAIAYPEDAEGYTLEWTSENENIATIDQKGMVTGISEGECSITVSAGNEISASAKVTVTSDKPDNITLSESSLNMKTGSTHTLTANVTPADAEYELVWSTDNEDVATVDNGTVTALSAGKATVTAKAGDISATCEITVENIDPEIGFYFYADGTYSKDLDSDKEPVGIIFWVGDPTEHDRILKRDHPECTHGLVVALSGDEKTTWQKNYRTYGKSISDWIKENASEFDPISSGNALEDPVNRIVGYGNTKAIEAFNAASENAGWQVDVVNKVVEYRNTVKAPAGTSDWYLPSEKELSLLCTGEYDGNIMEITDKDSNQNFLRINEIIMTVEGAVPLNASYYWPSLELDASKAFGLYFDFGLSYTERKDFSNSYYRSVLAF